MDELIKSRKTEEEDLRRYKATRWLVSLFGPLGIPEQPCEKEFISCLQNDFILGNLLNKIRPSSFPKIERAPSSSHSLPSASTLVSVNCFKNVQNFLSLMDELDIPTPEASVFMKDNWEEGSSAKLVDCMLALEYHCKGKQIEIIVSSEPEPEPKQLEISELPEPAPSPTCFSLSWPAWAFLTWETRFNLARCLLGAAAMICGIFADYYYCLSVQSTIVEKANNGISITEAFGICAIVAAIICLPFAMYGKHWVIHSYIGKKPNDIGRKWRWGSRAVMLIITSVTMCASVVVTPTEDDGKDWILSASLLLTSAVLCEAALLDDDSWGVTEFIICFLLMQIRKTYKLNLIFLLGIATLCYIEKLMLMICMKEMKKHVIRVKEGDAEKTNVETLKLCLKEIDRKLRENIHVDVDTTFPELAAMLRILRTMKDEKEE